MATSRRQVNWTGVVFTPLSGGAATITGVTGIEVNPGGNLIKFSGDGDRGPTTIVNDFIDNSVTINTADGAAVRGISPGVRGSLVFVHNDAKSGTTAAGGGMAYTLANAICGDNPTGGQHRQFGAHRLMFAAEWADSTTNPLSVTAL